MSAPIKCQTLHAAAELGEPVIAYSGLAARALGDDPIASIILCQMWFWTRGGTRRSSVDAGSIYGVTGVNPARQRRARRALKGRGWLREKTRRGEDGRLHVTYAVDRDRALLDLRAFAGAERDRRAAAMELSLLASVGNEPGEKSIMDSAPCEEIDHGHMQKSIMEPVPPCAEIDHSGDPDPEEIRKEEIQEHGATRPLSLEQPEPDATRVNAPPEGNRSDRAGPRSAESELKPIVAAEDVLNGLWDDDVPGARGVAVLAVVLRVLSETWHGQPRAVVPSKQRRNLWSDWVDAGGRPSDAMRAIHGMRHDDWDRRGDHADLRHLLGSVDRWVGLYHSHHVRGVEPRWPRRRADATPAGLRPWRGVYLPAERTPTEGDRFALDAGYVFVFDEREWVDPRDDPRGLVAKHRARYGDANVSEVARARIGADRVA
jgi:hypothetical protein